MLSCNKILKLQNHCQILVQSGKKASRLIGNDRWRDKPNGKIPFDISAAKDTMLKRSPENFEKHVKNIYRTLLTRGMKGCYLCFTDKETEEYFRVRMESSD